MTENGRVVQLYGDEYIKVGDAFEYLENREVVFKLDNIYYEFNGFATEYELDFNYCSDDVQERRYLRAVARVCPEQTSFWGMLKSADCFEVCFLNMVSGYINGIEINDESIHEYYVNGNDGGYGDNPLYVGFESCFVKKSELDELAEKYGISLKKLKNEDIEKPYGVIDDRGSELNPKLETTYQHIIAVLLSYIKGEVPSIEAHQAFTTEAAMIDLLADKYAGYGGMSKRTLEDKFAQAKKKLKE